jgi:hypothetical protein
MVIRAVTTVVAGVLPAQSCAEPVAEGATPDVRALAS